MQRAGALWTWTGKLKTGRSHAFYYMVDGQRVGGKSDVAAYGPHSYTQPGVPEGKLSEKMAHTSKIYEGMKSDYWIYVPAQYDPGKGAALMVWQDGQGLTQRDGATRAQIVFDNLTHRKKIPVMIHVFISPGLIGTRRMRSVEYDTVNDQYARFLRDEVLPEVYAKYNIRKDGYSRAIAGNSSGGICAFNAAWFQPVQFSRVLSRIVSFHQHPVEARRDRRRQRISIQGPQGAETKHPRLAAGRYGGLENEHGSWPLQNLQMANSLKMKNYDFHLSLGNGTHNGAHSSSELPEEMMWLWRDYDPGKTGQTYEMEPSEKTKPLFRVKVYNRE